MYDTIYRDLEASEKAVMKPNPDDCHVEGWGAPGVFSACFGFVYY